MDSITYVTGHRHPDSDSICAAITYADLLRRCGTPAVACRQGPLNEETKFILKQFHQENPLLLTDARASIADIEIDQPNLIRCDETVHHAWHVMLNTQNRSLFVVDTEGNLCGICTTSNLSAYRLKRDTDLEALLATAKIKDIAWTIAGKVVECPDQFSTNGKVHIITLEGNEAEMYQLAGGISILSGGKQRQKMIIERGAKLLVITCGCTADEEVRALAKEHGTAIIETTHDTMHTARIITESYTVEHIMTKNLISFRNDEYVDDVAAKMTKSRVRSYPVVNEEGKVVGAISRYHTLNYNRRKIVLVDHSAMNQSIQHLETAQIDAIVDHHHIGDVQTTYPILYRNVRCGSTCTIISTMYQENGLLPDPDMSGLLLSAILSDTLNFKSATTTQMDRVAANWLAKRAGIEDIDDYARKMLGASVALTDSTPHEILNRDLKTYAIGHYHFAIGQTNYSHMEDVQKLLPSFKENLEKEQEDAKLDLLVMLFTDVMGGGSLFVFYGPLSYVLNDLVETTFDEHSGFDSRIISRKQQLMPKLSSVLNNL